MDGRSDGAEMVAVFCGHMIDRQGRAMPRFPASAEESVARRIRDWLAANPVRTVFSSAACGADILLLEAAVEAGSKIHILLPFAAEEFVKTSVAHGGDRWIARFHRMFERASSLTIVNKDVADPDGSVFDFTNRLVAAQGVLHADAHGMKVRGLAVWNGLRGDGGGGTTDAVGCWIKAGLPVDVIHPLEPTSDGPARGAESIPPVPFANIHSALPSGARGEVGFFAHFHFVDYQRFPEAVFPVFQRLVLVPLAAHLADSGHRIVGRYGFGGDYVIAFQGVRAALETAQGALGAVLTSLAEKRSEIAPPSVCLHVGPVQVLVNPVLNQYAHEGGVLLRAAQAARRLPAGKIFCTAPFAALSALEAVRHFRFEPMQSEGAENLFTVVAADSR